MKDLDYYLAAKVISTGVIVTIFGQSILEYLSFPKRDISLLFLFIMFGTMYWVGSKQVDLLVSILATCVVILVFWAGSNVRCKEDYYQLMVLRAFEGSPAVISNYQAESYEDIRELIYRNSHCSDDVASEIVELYQNWRTASR